MEKSSIEHPDLFGLLVQDYAEIDDIDTHNPFARFLTDLANETPGIAEFDEYGWRNWPQYRVCIREAEQLTNGDAELLEDIFKGRVILNEMPKEIRQSYDRKKQADWVRAKRDEYRQRLSAYLHRKTSAEEPAQ